ncbi:MAG: hypothetical protein QOE33_543 [Acidobacteriota bacterium]|nr:hypothetical protein [Acidobacteriota bacterium]
MSLNLNGQSMTSASVNDPSGSIASAYTRHLNSGANWFFWIAGLSLINSIVSLSKGSWSFLAGLGITQIFDGLANGLSDELGGGATAVALILDLLVAACFVALGMLARRAMLWAFVVGMVIYALDGVLLAFFQVWLSVAFHAFALYSIYRGFNATRKLAALKSETGVGLMEH